MNQLNHRIIVYCDGSCWVNPGGKGGYASLIFYEDRSLVENRNDAYILYGSSSETTNNVMELLGVLKSLEFIIDNLPLNVHIYTDSKYICLGVSEWIRSWRNNNWCTSTDKEIKNKDIWMNIDALLNKMNVTIEWTKAHYTDEYNNIVDIVAKYAGTHQLSCVRAIEIEKLKYHFWRNSINEYLKY